MTSSFLVSHHSVLFIVVVTTNHLATASLPPAAPSYISNGFITIATVTSPSSSSSSSQPNTHIHHYPHAPTAAGGRWTVFINFPGNEGTQEAQTQMSKWSSEGNSVKLGLLFFHHMGPKHQTKKEWGLTRPLITTACFVSLTSGVCYIVWMVSFLTRHSFHFAFSNACQEGWLWRVGRGWLSLLLISTQSSSGSQLTL